MTVASAATGLFTFVSVSNVPWSLDATFSNGLSSFITSVSLGQAWLGITLIAAAVTVLCFAVRNQTAIVFVTLLAMATVVPMDKKLIHGMVDAVIVPCAVQLEAGGLAAPGAPGDGERPGARANEGTP